MIRFILSISVILLFSAGCTKSETGSESTVSVVVAPAIKADLIDSGEIVGQAKAESNVDLIARVQGFLTKRLFTEGEIVKKGDLLFEIEKDKYQADVESAEAELLRAQARMKNATIDYNRQKGLREKDAIAQKEFDRADYNYMDAKGEVMETESKLKTAKLNLSYTEIRAPFDGQVGVTNYSVGNFVGYNNTKLANIASIDPMRVQFGLSELIVIDFMLNGKFEKNADNVVVKLKFQNGEMYPEQGKLYVIDNKINTSTGTVQIEALFPNPKKLLIPGMYVKVILQKKGTVSGIVIPQAAVQQTQAGPQTLVVSKDGTVELRMIKTDIVNPPNIQVTSGIKEGELVIIEGTQYVRPGMKVKYTVDKAYEAYLKTTDKQ